MRLLHRAGLYSWSRFDESRNIDFNGVLWVREGGNVVIDPMPLSDHETARLKSFGGVAHIIVTNSDHVRAAGELRAWTGAKLYGPAGEKAQFPLAADVWLRGGESIVPGLEVHVLEGSKTPGELSLVIEGSTLVTGDLIRAHQAAKLNLLPNEKLKDRPLALSSVRRLFEQTPHVEAVLVGDGWPVFTGGRDALRDLVATFET